MMAAVQPTPLRLAYLADPNSVHTARWIGFFAQRGHQVDLLIGTDDEVRGTLPDGVRLHRYPRFGRRRLPFLSSLQGRRAIRRVLADLRPQVLHAHYLSRYGWQARLSGFHPYVVTPWGSDLFVTPRRSLRARLWARWTLRGADLVTVVSEQMRTAVLSAGARADRVTNVQFGVDTNRFSPGPAAGATPGVPGLEGRVLFSPRSLRPLYRHEVIVQALATLPSDLRLVMGARNEDARYRHDLEAQARSLGVGDQILILDAIDDEQMLGLYRSASVVVSVPDSDGLPVSVLEAMSCGTLIVASDLPGVRELMEPVAPHLLVPAGDAASLATAVLAALELGADERRAVGASLRDRVLAVADQRVNMLRMESLYRTLAARR